MNAFHTIFMSCVAADELSHLLGGLACEALHAARSRPEVTAFRFHTNRALGKSSFSQRFEQACMTCTKEHNTVNTTVPIKNSATAFWMSCQVAIIDGKSAKHNALHLGCCPVAACLFLHLNAKCRGSNKLEQVSQSSVDQIFHTIVLSCTGPQKPLHMRHLCTRVSFKNIHA
jgi:hypothetical protein